MKSSKSYDFLLIYLLGLLLLGDVVFIVIHILRAYFSITSSPIFSSSMFSINHDRSYAEFFQYIKFFWSILNLSAIGLLIERSYFAWSLFFGYLLADDAFLLHENLGNLIFNKLGFAPRSETWMMMRIQDYGEIIVSLLAALFFLVVIGFAYQRGSSAFRRNSRRIVYLVLALAFFGVAVDIVHSITQVMYEESTTTGMYSWFLRIINLLLVVIEDGGEMIITSLIFCYTLTEVGKIDRYQLRFKKRILDASQKLRGRLKNI